MSNKRINELDAITSISNNDVIPLDQYSGGNYLTKKITAENLGNTINLPPYHSVGVYGTEPTFTDNGDGTVDLGAFDILLKSTADGLSPIKKYSVSATNDLSFTDGLSQYIYVDYNGGTPTVNITTDYTIFDEATKVPIYKCWRVGNVVHSLSGDSAGVGLSNKIATMLSSTHTYNRAGNSGLVISEITSPNPRTITVTQAYVYSGTYPQLVLQYNSSIDTLTKATVTNGTWSYDSTASVYDNTNYNPTTGPIALSSNNYGVRWFYRSIGDIKEVFYVLGTGNYNKQADALLEVERTDLPPVIKQHCMLIGRSVIQHNATNGSTQSLLLNVYSGATVTDHNDLNNIQGGTTGAYYHSNKPLDTIFTDTKFTTGILNIHTSSTNQRVNTTLSFNDSTHIFSIAPSGGSYTTFDIYLSGFKTTFNSAQTIDLDDVGLVTNTLYFIYFIDVGGVATLQCSTTAWTINSNAAPIATIFWNGSIGIIGDERHDATRNLTDHKYNHENKGCQYTTGFDGTFNVDGTFSIGAGRLADEDIVLVSSGAVTTARIWYTTTGPKSTVDGTTSVSAYVSAGALKYNPTSTYTFESVTSGYYVRNYIYGTNDTGLPIALIVGNNEYNNLNDARNDTFPESPTYINNEVRLLYTTIWQNVGGTATFIESTDYRTAPSQANGKLAIRPIFLDQISDVNAPTPQLDQVLRWNGSAWVNGSPATSSASAGVEWFNASPTITATGTNNAIIINTLSKTPVTTTQQTLASNLTLAGGTTPISAWLYNTALGRTTIDAGTWSFNEYAGVNSITAGRITTINRGVYSVLTQDGGSVTVTITGTGTSRTATASSGTPFATTKIDASATNTTASYLQTSSGLYQITARTSDTVVTISTPSTYSNQSAVTFNVWKRLFNTGNTIAITSITQTYNLYNLTSAQGSFTITTSHKLGAITFATSNNTTTLTTVYDGTTNNTHFDSPLITLHNDLAGLQGGTSGEMYHLNSTEYTSKVSGPASATNGNFVSFNGTTGKIIQDSGLNSSSFALAAKGVTNGDSHDHNGGDGAAIVEAAITLADNTTNNVSATKHGFFPKLSSVSDNKYYGIKNGAVTEIVNSKVITIVFDGGGSAVTAGTKTYLRIPIASTITKYTLLADVSGSAVIDVWKDTYANYPPTVADTITASAKPTLSSAIKTENSTLTGWTTTITAGDVLGFNVDSCTTCTKLILELEVTV